ncbi:hypothetical protein BC831DRAFT_505416 [Entophlyctis helioformis]|nr:hypothetical protein BC831DRAFT_505416 [Entophlyctis helioformis]
MQDLGSVIIGLLLDNDTSVRAAAANAALDMASDSLWCFWVSENGSLFARAIAAQTERHMILNLLGAIRRRNVKNNLWDNRHKRELLGSILPMLDMDEEVASDAATCIPFFVPSDASEFNDMHVVLAVINKLKSNRKGLVQRAVQAGILDALDAILAQPFAAIDQHRELVRNVFRIVVLIISQNDLALISLVGHQDKELARMSSNNCMSPSGTPTPPVMRPSLRGTCNTASFLLSSRTSSIRALEMAQPLNAAHTVDGVCRRARESRRSQDGCHWIPRVLQDLIHHTYMDGELLEKLLEIMDKHFPKHFKTADPSILPNKNSTGLPKSLIPGMEQWYLTLKEREYLVLRGTILNKPLWWTKFTDATIAAQWRDEAAPPGVTQRALSLLFSELAYLAKREIRTVKLASGDAMTVTPGAVKCTTMSDDAVPESLRDALIRQVAVLEDVPDHKKDWHPGSDGKVLDLVHPSLYPLVYGRSLVLSLDDRATATSTPPWDVMSASELVSLRFQWLPSEFLVHDNGTVSINSYINNLHPIWSNSLYKMIAKIRLDIHR